MRRPLLVALVLVAVFALGAGVGWLVFPPDDESSTTLSAADTAPAPVASVASSSTTTTTTTTIIPPKPRRGTMAFTGDLLPHGPVVNAAAANAAAGWDFLPMFAEVAPIISAADVAICHLETPLSLDDTDISGYPVFNAPRALAEAARDAGYDGCSTASNHSYDRGASGVESTVQVMDEVGLAQAGMAVSEAGDLTPLFYDVDGISVAHISATYGLNGFELPADRPYMVDLIDPAPIVEEARLAREAGAEFVVVSLHWGTEYRSEPDDAQVAWMKEILPAADVDLIIGHHAHVVQPVDRFGDEWVVYGLGNFLSNQSANCCVAASQDGMIATVQLNETSPGTIEAVAVDYTPTWVDRGNGYVIRVAGDRSGSGLPEATVAALATSWDRTTAVVGSRLLPTDGLSVADPVAVQP